MVENLPNLSGLMSGNLPALGVGGAVLLVVGYMIISKIVGIAFRIIVPLILLGVLAGGLGLSSGVGSIGNFVGEVQKRFSQTSTSTPITSPAKQPIQGGPARAPNQAAEKDVSEITLGEIGGVVANGARALLTAALDLLGGPVQEPGRNASSSRSPRDVSHDAPGGGSGWRGAP